MTSCDSLWLTVKIVYWLFVALACGFLFFMAGRSYEKAQR